MASKDYPEELQAVVNQAKTDTMEGPKKNPGEIGPVENSFSSALHGGQIVEYLKTFPTSELKEILSTKDPEGESLMHRVIGCNMAAAAVECIYNADRSHCIELLGLKGKSGIRAIDACLDRDDIVDILKHFTSSELKTILVVETETEGNIGLWKSSSGIYDIIAMLLRKVPAKTARYLCRKLDQEAVFKGKVHEIVEKMESDQLEGCLAKKDDQGCSAFFWLLNTKFAEVVAIRARALILNELKLAGLLFVSSLNALVLPDQGQLIEHILSTSKNLFRFGSIIGSFVLLLKRIFEPNSADEKEKMLRQLCWMCNGTKRPIRQMLLSSFQDGSMPQKLLSQIPEKQFLWLKMELKDSHYLLPTQPRILIISNSKDRPGAKKEATSLVSAFESLKLNVHCKSDLTKKQIYAEIEKGQKTAESKSSQIVVMMSHGKAGHIFDNEGQPIPIADLETRMSPKSHVHSPKILILQCCQSVGVANLPLEESQQPSETNTPDANIPVDQAKALAEKYSMEEKNFQVIISCVNGQVSHRNEFIPKLAEEVRDLQKGDSLYKAFLAAHSALEVDQTPLHMSTMQYKLSLRNIYDPNKQYQVPLKSATLRHYPDDSDQEWFAEGSDDSDYDDQSDYDWMDDNPMNDYNEDVDDWMDYETDNDDDVDYEPDYSDNDDYECDSPDDDDECDSPDDDDECDSPDDDYECDSPDDDDECDSPDDDDECDSPDDDYECDSPDDDYECDSPDDDYECDSPDDDDECDSPDDDYECDSPDDDYECDSPDDDYECDSPDDDDECDSPDDDYECDSPDDDDECDSPDDDYEHDGPGPDYNDQDYDDQD